MSALSAIRGAAARSRLWPALAICVAALILTLPSLLNGFPALGYDSRSHVVRYLHFSAQLWQGEAYPRWLSGMSLGLGSPSMFVYPPLAYYVTSLFRPLAAVDPFGWYQLAAGATAALAASGGAVYLWLRHHVDRAAALVAAMIYMALPYHIGADHYLRGAFAEFWAFAWMPLALWQIDRMGQGRHTAVVGLAVVYGMLIMTHPPTTLAFSAVALCYALVVAGAGRRTRLFLAAGAGLALGIGLAAVYLLPLVVHQANLHAADMPWRASGYFETRFLFQDPSRSPNPTGNRIYTVMVSLTVILAILATAVRALGRSMTTEVRYWGVVAMLSLFMMTPLSTPVWELMPILERLNFPWRFATVLTLAAAALAGYALAMRGRAPAGVVASFAALGVVVVAASLVMVGRLALNTTPADKSAQNAVVAMGAAPMSLWPKWAFARRPALKERLLSENRGLPFGFEEPYLERLGPEPPRAMLSSGEGSWRLDSWQPRRIVLDVDAPEGATVTVGRLFYPGWQARPSGGACCLRLVPSDPDGLISIEVPPGSHEIVLDLRADWTERLGLALSIASALAAIGLALRLHRRRASAGA